MSDDQGLFKPFNPLRAMHRQPAKPKLCGLQARQDNNLRRKQDAARRTFLNKKKAERWHERNANDKPGASLRSNEELDQIREELGYSDAMADQDKARDKLEFPKLSNEYRYRGAPPTPWYLIPRPGPWHPDVPLAELLDGPQFDWIHDHGLFKHNVSINDEPGTTYGPNRGSYYEGCE